MRRRILHRVASIVAVLTCGLAAATASAQDPGEVPSTISDTDPSNALGVVGKQPYWSGGKSRPFAAAVFEAGLVYIRPTLALGYGKPHWRWLGVEVQSRISTGTASNYTGLRFVLPQAELRLGGRYSFGPSNSYLVRAETYTDDTISFDEEPNSRYFSLEGELSGALPIGDGAIVGSVAAFHMLGVPSEYDVYDQLLHVVVEPPWALRQRAGYVHAFGADRGLKVGAAVELVEVPERDAVIVRVGPQLGVSITHHLDASLSIMAVVASPDSLRLAGTDIGQFGFRYRWATGDPFPEFP